MLTERYHEIISGFSGYEIESAYRQKETYLEKIQKDFIENLSKLFVIPVKVSLKDIPEYIALIESHRGIKIGVVGIDYLGLLDARGPNEYEIISRLARDVKTMAKETNLPVVLLTQTSRKAGSGDTEVTVDMGRGSGAIEKAADFVLGLFQDERQTDNGEPEYDLICKILKNRKGPRNSMWKLDLDPRNFRLGPEAQAWKPATKRGRGNDL